MWSTCSEYIQFVTHNLRVLYCQNVCNSVTVDLQIFHVYCVSMFTIYLHTKFHTSDSVVSTTKTTAELQINKIIKQKQVKTIREGIRHIVGKRETITVIKSCHDMFTYLIKLYSAWTWCYNGREWCKQQTTTQQCINGSYLTNFIK